MLGVEKQQSSDPRFGFASKVLVLEISLWNLCVLCVSVVCFARNSSTTETQRTQRLHREEGRFGLLGQSFRAFCTPLKAMRGARLVLAQGSTRISPSSSGSIVRGEVLWQVAPGNGGKINSGVIWSSGGKSGPSPSIAAKRTFAASGKAGSSLRLTVPDMDAPKVVSTLRQSMSTTTFV